MLNYMSKEEVFSLDLSLLSVTDLGQIYTPGINLCLPLSVGQ